MLSDFRSLKGDLEAEGSCATCLQQDQTSQASRSYSHWRLRCWPRAAVAYHFYFATPAPSPNEKSIAVLPFADLSQARDQEYLCDGIQEEILTRLSKIADLKVISRTSTQRYKSAPGEAAGNGEAARRGAHSGRHGSEGGGSGARSMFSSSTPETIHIFGQKNMIAN